MHCSFLEGLKEDFRNLKLFSLKESELYSQTGIYSSYSKENLEKVFSENEDFIDRFIMYYRQNGRSKFNLNSYQNDFQKIKNYLILLVSLREKDNFIIWQDVIRNVKSAVDRLNRLSKYLGVHSDDCHINLKAIFLDAQDLCLNNKNLKPLPFKLKGNLYEHKLSQFDTSKITDKSISEYGLNEAKLIDASFGKDSITIQFEVESTGDNTHVDLAGKTQVFLKRGYSVTIQFANTDNYLSPTNVNKDAIAQQFNSVIQNCDAKVYCDCPAFYWQGMAEKDAKQGDSYFGFRGQHGTGYWNNLHNVNGPQACKHIWSAIYFVNTEQKQICDKLASKVVNSANVYNNIIRYN